MFINEEVGVNGLHLVQVYLKNWQLGIYACRPCLFSSWMMAQMSHYASLAPPVFACCLFGCAEPHVKSFTSTRPEDRTDRMRHPLADTLNENLWVISFNTGHRVHELVARILLKIKGQRQNIYQLERATFCFNSLNVLPGRFERKNEWKNDAFLPSFKTCLPSPQSPLTFPNVDSPVNHDIIHWAGFSLNKSVRANSAEPSQQPTATCRSTHLIRLPISANYNAAYRRHLATTINVSAASLWDYL